ncbi:MAG: HAD-IIIC family phosphatase, partial [Candidatus Omnitrophica bacterium]|nr:HAD-IIIC family phosphatase [Candidatus Omnitrophota bacterium]
MKDPFVFPFDTNFILRKKKAIKREFLLRQDLPEKKIAILGGSTTSEIKDILELFLLKEKIKPIFYESGFNRYYEDIMFDEPKLSQFKPDILYIHTTGVNINYPEGFIVDKEDIEDKIKNEFMKFKDLWTKIQEKYNCAVVQNNFELPYYRVLGNLDSSAISGKTYFLSRLNLEFAKYAQENKNFYINDINYLSSWLGLDKWHDRAHWYSYKYAISYEAIPLVCYNLANIIKSIYGQAKKCLVLDLDNILWGGVIGDVGMENIQIGRETPLAEAYAEFQRYIKELKERGVILAVCSKNDPEIARQGLAHPDSILKFDDFAVFKANWKRKDENIIDIAREINIGLDSLVFIDDNPAEREIVKANLQEVTVPDMGNNVEQYIGIIDGGKYFEPAAISFDDINRNSYYQGNLKRTSEERNFLNYG